MRRKSEEHAFDDFSKLLFLKLLEEKAVFITFRKCPTHADFMSGSSAGILKQRLTQVRNAIEIMITEIKEKTSYKDVLVEILHLKNAKTFRYIVTQLSSVSFHDSSLDSKGRLITTELVPRHQHAAGYQAAFCDHLSCTRVCTQQVLLVPSSWERRDSVGYPASAYIEQAV